MDELRGQFKRLLLKNHPDNGGNVSYMQEINAEYDLLFDRIKTKNKPEGQSYTYDENEENMAFKDVLNVIIRYRMEIEIIGSWVWCFECYAYKEKLKELGFKYAPKKKAWTWHFGNYKRYHKAITSLEDIRMKYGSQMVSHKEKQYVLNQ
jgi:hypothetical protein